MNWVGLGGGGELGGGGGGVHSNFKPNKKAEFRDNPV